MSSYNQVLQNVEWLLEKYGRIIDSEKKLQLLYWKYFDKIDITKDSIPTNEWINRSTSGQMIADVYWLIKIREEERVYEQNKAN